MKVLRRMHSILPYSPGSNSPKSQQLIDKQARSLAKGQEKKQALNSSVTSVISIASPGSPVTGILKAIDGTSALNQGPSKAYVRPTISGDSMMRQACVQFPSAGLL